MKTNKIIFSIIAGFLVVLILSNFVSADCPSNSEKNLIFWHTFDNDDRDGNTFYDQGRNRLNGINTGATSATGKIGQALNFATNTNVFRVKNYTNLNLQHNVTIAAWVKSKKAFVDDEYRVILTKQNGNIGSIGETPYELGTFGNKSYFWSANLTSNCEKYSNITLEINKWYYLVASYDADANRVKLYIDGELVQDVVDTACPNPMYSAPDVNISIGNLIISVGGSFPWNGTIDEVSLWNSTLTDEEIQSIYNSGNGRVCPICLPPVANLSWNVSLADNCSITESVDLQYGNLTLSNTFGQGNFTIVNPADVKPWRTFFIAKDADDEFEFAASPFMFRIMQIAG